MKTMRFFALCALFVYIISGVFGCAPARRPAEEERVVVPEVTKIFVETQELSEAPPIIQNLAKGLEEAETHLAVEAEGSVWVLATGDEGEEIEVKEAVQRVLNQDTTIIEIKLIESEDKQDKVKDETEPLVAKLNVESLNNGIVFSTEEEDEDEDEVEKQATGQEGKQTAPSKGGTTKGNDKASEKNTEEKVSETFRVDEPKPSQFIQSPVKVSGQAREANSTVTVRLRDSQGNILAETETLTGSNGKFSVSLSFDKPASISTGRLEVFVRNAPGGSSANTKLIPISFK